MSAATMTEEQRFIGAPFTGVGTLGGAGGCRPGPRPSSGSFKPASTDRSAGRVILQDSRPLVTQATVSGRLDTRWLLPHSIAVTIALAKDVEEFLQEQVRTGACADASELANDVLRSLREQQRKPFEVTPELEAWLLEAADQPTTPLTRADFDAIRDRVRARTKTSAA